MMVVQVLELKQRPPQFLYGGAWPTFTFSWSMIFATPGSSSLGKGEVPAYSPGLGSYPEPDRGLLHSAGNPAKPDSDRCWLEKSLGQGDGRVNEIGQSYLWQCRHISPNI